MGGSVSLELRAIGGIHRAQIEDLLIGAEAMLEVDVDPNPTLMSAVVSLDHRYTRARRYSIRELDRAALKEAYGERHNSRRKLTGVTRGRPLVEVA